MLIILVSKINEKKLISVNSPNIQTLFLFHTSILWTVEYVTVSNKYLLRAYNSTDSVKCNFTEDPPLASPLTKYRCTADLLVYALSQTYTTRLSALHLGCYTNLQRSLILLDFYSLLLEFVALFIPYFYLEKRGH